MDAQDLDKVMTDIIPRSPFRSEASNLVNFPTRQSPSDSDAATAALDLVSEAAAAIRNVEAQSAEAVTRAQDAAEAAIKKLELADARAERAETAQREAEAKVAELATATVQARKDLERLQSRLTAKEAELAAVIQRATVAEQRADDASAAIHRIVDAIRTQLTVTAGGACEEAGDAA